MRTRHFQSVIWLPLVALAGCAAPGSSSDVKTDAPTPSAAVAKEAATAATTAALPNSTVVVSTNYSMDGLILPVVRGQQTVQTRTDMRRTDSTLSFDNKFLRAIAGENQSADIVRLDKKIHWTLNTSKKTYRECPLAGCQTGTASLDKPKQEKPSKESEPSCPLTLKKNELKVVNTGEHKTIHAFNTEHIQVKWTMELQDKQKRITSNHVVLDLWTTPETGLIKQAQSVDETFHKNWITAIGGSEHPFNKYVPSEVLNSMNTLMHNMGAKNSSNLAAWSTELKKVHGYPISTTFTWNAEGNACGDSASGDQAGNSAKSGSVSDALGSLMGSKSQDKGKGSAKSGAARALMTYNHEVKSIEIKPVSDVSFAPESDYRRVQQ